MPLSRKSPTTLFLLLVAFITSLVTLAAVGLNIERHARQVRVQTHGIMVNGLPSLLSASLLKEILPQFQLAQQLYDVDRELGERSFQAASTRFGAIILQERRAVEFYPHERESVQHLLEAYERMVAQDRVLRQVSRSRPSRLREQRERVASEIGGLEAATEAFEQLNRDGIGASRTALFSLADLERSALRWGLLLAALVSIAWAGLLTRSIALPLARLKQDVRTLPEKVHTSEIRPTPFMPREILELLQAFRESAMQLNRLTLQRAEAHRQLEAALAREHGLNLDLREANASLDEQVMLKTAALAEANAQLSKLVQELQLKDKSKASFLAAVSHELRTPLAVVKGATLTLSNLGRTLDDASFQRLLGNILEESEHLAGLVEHLLDAARMEAGSFQLTPKADVDLRSLIDGVLKGLTTLFEDQEIRLVCRSVVAVGPLKGDADRIRQVLRNLLENAARFSPPGSTVTLEVRTLPPADGLPARIELSIEDAGPGVSDDVLPNLFTPFSRGASSRGGVGLGLAIAKQLVQAHGGQIGMRRLPTGSAFWFWLPL